MRKYLLQNLTEVPLSKVSAGALAFKIGNQYFVTAEDGSFIVDTGDASATEDHILANKTAYAKGKKITGNINTISLVIPSTDFVSGTFTTEYTLPSGLCLGGTVSAALDIPVKTAHVYTPTTFDLHVAENQWLLGDQTIRGDANLLPQNIKEDVILFGIKGTCKPKDEGDQEEQEFNPIKDIKIYHNFASLDSIGIPHAPETGRKANGFNYEFQLHINLDTSHLTILDFTTLMTTLFRGKRGQVTGNANIEQILEINNNGIINMNFNEIEQAPEVINYVDQVY